MAGQTILVVDDDPFNLKLLASVLRRDGFRVNIASSGEQALSMLNTMQPDAMLVDMQLPGIDGLELTRIARSRPGTAAIPILALTAANSREDELNAQQAGCDGFISKPVDTNRLATLINSYLEGRANRPPAPQLEEPSFTLDGPEMEGLRRKFLADGDSEIRRMLDMLNLRFDEAAERRLLHQWVGSAGALGYMDIATGAREAEQLLGRPGWRRNDLREILTSLLYKFNAPKEASRTAIPEAILRPLDTRHVAMVGFADRQADLVCSAFERAHARPRLFSAGEPVSSEAIGSSTVVMIHVRPETLGSEWLRPDAPFPAALPIVLVGAREDLLALDSRVQARACEYLIDGWQPEEVVMRLSFAISRSEAARQGESPKPASVPQAAKALPPAVPPKAPTGTPDILIADDDATVRTVVNAALKKLGMNCRFASSGTEAIRELQASCPTAAVLDVNMPGVDGFEVLAMIRQRSLPVKVVMLTARQQEADVLRGFGLGADDYVVKPFNPLELAARLKRLV